MSLLLITDREEIRRVLREYLAGRDIDGVRFIAAVHAKPGHCGHEGARPIGCSTGDGGEIYSFANGDSDYTTAVGSLSLEDITSIQLLRA